MGPPLLAEATTTRLTPGPDVVASCWQSHRLRPWGDPRSGRRALPFVTCARTSTAGSNSTSRPASPVLLDTAAT